MKKLLVMLCALFFIQWNIVVPLFSVFFSIVAKNDVPKKTVLKTSNKDDELEDEDDDIEIDEQDEEANEKKTIIELAKKSLFDLISTKITSDIEETTNKSNPYRSMNKPVYKADDLSEFEKEFLSKRLDFVRIQQAQLLKKKHITKDETLRIGLVFSGGGTPAYVASMGFMYALSNMNILNSALYAAASGASSGMLLKYMVNQGNVANMMKRIRAQAESKTFNPFTITRELKADLAVIAREVFWPRIVFKRDITNTDLFGALLVRKILPELGDRKYRTFLYNFENTVRSGDILFPLFNAVLRVRERPPYWLEFSPVEVIELSSDVAVPSFAFDRVYQEGEAQDRGPTRDVGSLLGMWWESTDSVIPLKAVDTINKKKLEKQLDEVNTVFKGEVNSIFNKVTGVFEAIQNQILAVVLKTISFVGVREKTIVNNPWLEFDEAPGWLDEEKKLHIESAYTESGVVGQSMLRQDREIDIIFVLDASESADKRTDLNNFFMNAKKMGYSYIQVDEGKNETFGVYEDEKGHGPGVIYLNNQKNKMIFTDTYLKYRTKLRTFANTYSLQKFDPEICAHEAACSMFGFDLNKDLFDGFFGLAFFNAYYNEKAIMQALDRFYVKKREKLGLDDGAEGGEHPGFHTVE